MTDPIPMPPFAGQTFEVNYGGLVALNAYDTAESFLTYTITAGASKGTEGRVSFQWKEIAPQVYVISWQESDGATVVHIDDFTAHTSLSFYTTPGLDLYRLVGSLKVL